MPDSFEARIKGRGLDLGFDWIGLASASAPAGYAHFLHWLDRGSHAGMEYMATGAAARSHPESLLPGVRTIVVAAMIYAHGTEPPTGPSEGKVARYARGLDYHEVFWKKLDLLLDWIKQERPKAVGRSVVDSAPLLERDFARLAGLGWIGKNTMLISKGLGSYTLLGMLLLDLELEPDQPFELNHCGTCTRCLEACPTDAFEGPYQLDAGKCLSYWTIEHRGIIPEEFRSRLDGWLFGCDVCQDVCPWNRKAGPPRSNDLEPTQEHSHIDLIDLISLEPAELSSASRGRLSSGRSGPD